MLAPNDIYPYNIKEGKEKTMAESTVTSKGQTTVPVQVRAALHAEPGTRLEWHVTPDGDVIVRAKTRSILDLKGSVKTDLHVKIEDMNPWRS
jgi:AbrB family looped-hinge helix DNA binding protein